MRLWSIHPKYLDGKGLVALWREGLLAQKVLRGKTKGYRNHPQLDRFKKYPGRLKGIGSYLTFVYDESKRRGYNFERSKIKKTSRRHHVITVTRGQMGYEFNHLKGKVKKRTPLVYKRLLSVRRITPHPLFSVIPGTIECWERR